MKLLKTHVRFIQDIYNGHLVGEFCLVTDKSRNSRKTAKILVSQNYVREVECVRVTRTSNDRKPFRRQSTGFVLTDSGLRVARKLAAEQ